MKVSKNFDLREFVPEKLWIARGEQCIWFIHPKVISLAQFYKDFFTRYFGEEVTITINDWLWGGDFDERGWRYPDTETGSELSFHKGGLCSAFDCEVRYKAREINPQRIRTIIKAHAAEFMAVGLTTLESGEYATGWVHSDVRNTGLDTILIVGDSQNA